MRPRLLDLFCGAGGAAMGYHRAGFEVTGVDIVPQPRYPCGFVQADALDYCRAHGHEYPVIHASPPCQAYSRMRHLPWLRHRTYPCLLEPVQHILRQMDVLWVIENVESAPLDGIVFCGQMFGLPLYRHRRFASNILLFAPDQCRHTTVICSSRRAMAQRYRQRGGRDVTGVLPGVRAEDAMGIDWMTRKELSQAIPPVYTAWVGQQLLRVLGVIGYRVPPAALPPPQQLRLPGN